MKKVLKMVNAFGVWLAFSAGKAFQEALEGHTSLTRMLVILVTGMIGTVLALLKPPKP